VNVPVLLAYSRSLPGHLRPAAAESLQDAAERGHRVHHLRIYAAARRLLDLDLARNGSSRLVAGVRGEPERSCSRERATARAGQPAMLG
jgi:hypothetical protein